MTCAAIPDPKFSALLQTMLNDRIYVNQSKENYQYFKTPAILCDKTNVCRSHTDYAKLQGQNLGNPPPNSMEHTLHF